jgi:hypothetical protein
VPAKHPNAEVFEHVYDCFTSGDMDTLAELIASHVVWHVPGDNLISGTYTSRDGIFGYFSKIFELSGCEGVVPVPSAATAYRRLAELAKGTNAVSGSAKGRRSIADGPKGVYGRLRALRPGEYAIVVGAGCQALGRISPVS